MIPKKSKVSVREISKKIAKEMIVKHHYSHAWTSCRYALGIFYEMDNQHSFFDEKEEKLAGVAIYGYPVGARAAGSISDYKYSKAMAAHGKNWSFEEMNGFLIKPKDWIKGTKMSFAGLKKAEDRAAVILYMNENTNSPLQLQ